LTPVNLASWDSDIFRKQRRFLTRSPKYRPRIFRSLEARRRARPRPGRKEGQGLTRRAPAGATCIRLHAQKINVDQCALSGVKRKRPEAWNYRASIRTTLQDRRFRRLVCPGNLSQQLVPAQASIPQILRSNPRVPRKHRGSLSPAAHERQGREHGHGISTQEGAGPFSRSARGRSATVWTFDPGKAGGGIPISAHPVPCVFWRDSL
jgi:hypothetical protein